MIAVVRDIFLLQGDSRVMVNKKDRLSGLEYRHALAMNPLRRTWLPPDGSHHFLPAAADFDAPFFFQLSADLQDILLSFFGLA